MEQKIKVDSDSIKSLALNIDNEGKKFEMLLNKIQEKTILMEKAFNTPTCNIFRDKLSNYINTCKNYVNKNYATNVDVLKCIAKLYDNTTNTIAKRVGNN